MAIKHGDYHSPPNHKHHIKLIVVGIFLLILIVLLITSFFGDFGITGGVIGGGGELNVNNSIPITANLEGLPLILIDGEYRHVVIRGFPKSDFYVGDEKFPLEDSEDNFIILSDYDGKISFNQERISILKGKASQVSINGMSVLPKSKDQVKVSIDKAVNYTLLEVPGVFIQEIDYKTSGELNLGEEKTKINLDNDPITLKSFQGDLEVKNNRLHLNGRIRSIKVKGKQEISISI